MNSLKEEIAEEFNNCVGFHEGINVPDCHVGKRAIDYADKVLKLVEKRIDARIAELKSGMNDKKIKNLLPEEKWKGYYEKLEQSFDELEMLKKEMLK